MNFDTDALLQFAQDNWFIVVLAVAAILLVVKLVKTVLKWVLVIAIVVGIAAYAGYSIDDLSKMGSNIVEQASREAQDQAIKLMAGEATEAKYVANDDGSYTITTPSLELNGVPNSGEVSVKVHGISIGKLDMEGAVRNFVVQARSAAQ